MTTAFGALGLQMTDSDQSRIAVLETKVLNLNEKIDELKVDVREMHDCLDKTRDLLKEELKVMRAEASTQHESLSKKFNRLEDFKNKGIYISIGAAAVIGWLLGHSELVKLFIQ
jgi:lipid II:glycine glycyltransferase (peptidoglycan interpeptide bridge formation enzyme)